jgi:hypothetical protein
LKVAIPFNEALLGDKKRVGLDAYFWPSLAKRYRVVLLVHPAEKLYEEPPRGIHRLRPRISIDEQIRDLHMVSRLVVEGRAKGPRLGLTERLMLLFAPWLVMYRLKNESVTVPEEVQAKGLAEYILREGLQPTGKILWMVFEETNDERVLMPEDESMANVYSVLAERDDGYRRVAHEAIRAAQRDNLLI